MIERVHFKNFKSLQDVTLDLGPLTALVGVNGCGKSSALEGIHLLSQTGRRAPRSANPNQENFLKQRWQRLGATFSGARSPRRLATQDQPTDIELSMRALDQDALHLTISLPALTDEDRADDPLTFHVSLDGPAGALSASIPPTHGEDADLVLDHPRVRRFTSAVYLNLNAREMARASIPEGTHPRMRFDGYGLASTLAWMKGEVEEELAMITEDLRKIVPGVRRIRTQRQELTHRRTERMTIDGQPIWRPVEETILGDRFAVEFDGGHVIPADLLSEGTVLALGLLTKLREPQAPSPRPVG